MNSSQQPIEIKCHHCGNTQLYRGNNRYTNCHACGYKIFIKEDNTPIDPAKLDIGVGTLNLKFNPESDRIRIIPWGDVHQLAVAKGGKYHRGQTHKSYYILTGHFLNWVGSYAQAFGMDVCPSGCPKVTLFGDRKDIHVSI